MAAFVKFWGARGSIPTPASWTRVYGGNTSCVEVRFDDTLFVCDAGSGIRELGKDLLARQPAPKDLHLLLTHAHWDHIQGFPFFAPLYMPGMKIRVYGRQAKDHNPYHLLSGQMSSAYFPVSLRDVGSRVVADYLDDGNKDIHGVLVRAFALNHPGGCLGYCLSKDGTKIVYATDHELEIQPGDVFPDLDDSGPLRQMPEELVEVAREADLLIMDSQYDDKGYAARKSWGHSSCFSATDLAIRANVKHLALFHHDPEDTDRDVDQKVLACQQRATRHGSRMAISAAREGVELKFG
jgi:phosphoribosyl 1,2-cyclic phosphodiesterase